MQNNRIHISIKQYSSFYNDTIPVSIEDNIFPNLLLFQY